MIHAQIVIIIGFLLIVDAFRVIALKHRCQPAITSGELQLRAHASSFSNNFLSLSLETDSIADSLSPASVADSIPEFGGELCGWVIQYFNPKFLTIVQLIRYPEIVRDLVGGSLNLSFLSFGLLTVCYGNYHPHTYPCPMTCATSNYYRIQIQARKRFGRALETIWIKVVGWWYW